MPISRVWRLTGVVLCLMASTAAWAENALAPALVITGIATTPQGKPVANTALYMVTPPGDSGMYHAMTHLGPGPTVVTDAQGRFTWTLSTDTIMNVSLDSSAPACYAMANESHSWKLTVALARNYDADTGRRDLLDKAALKCETRWLQTGTKPQMAVVVPSLGLVNILVRRPDGQALAGHRVQVVAPETFSDYEGAVVYEGCTDAYGHLQMRWPPGLRRLLISVPGVGFGATGFFEILPDKEATPQIPPLAPFARVSGTVLHALPSYVHPGAFVHMEDTWFDEHKWYDPHAAVDAQGRFTLSDVLPGEHSLVLVDGRKAMELTSLTLYPGEQVAGITGEPKHTDTPFVQNINVRMNPAVQPGAPKPSVRGRVMDSAGNPVAEADVYALCSYDGGIRQYQEVLTAKTGADGAYLIPGLPVGQGGSNVSLVAVHPGYPPATSGDSKGDLVLPPGHPGLTVQVLRGGKPLEGASVRLTPQTGTGLFDRFYVGSARGPARESVARRLEPTAVTDAAGEAHFTDLAAGLWDITATEGKPETLDSIGRWPGVRGQTAAFSISQGVVVEAGPPRRFTVSVYPQPGNVTFQVLAPNGQPPTDPTIAFEFGMAGEPNGSSTSVTLDKNGYGENSFAQPGLWRIVTRFRDTALASFPANAEPFYEGSALIAISPALSKTGPVVLHAIRRGPGRIRVRLLDSVGHPKPGVVFIGDTFDNAKYGASLDRQGEAVFTDMSSGQYLLRANFAGQPVPPALGHEGQPFPTDAALTGIKLLVPQTAVVKSDAETLVTFRPQPQGYLRGKLAAPDDPKNYAVFFPNYSDTPPTARYDLKTGEFVIGPFPSGKTMLHVQRTTPDAVDYAAFGKDFPVNVPTGAVAHVTLTPALPVPPTVPAGQTEAMMTMGGVFSSDRSMPLMGRVFLPDGVTPAWGARAALVVPQTWQPVQMARADALGRLSVGDYWYSSEQPSDPPPGSPTEPVLVAWLPGANGAVVIPHIPGQEEKLVLPEPFSVQGRVTVNGNSVASLTSSFRVVAAYQGRGKLNPLLSVEATTQADGTFDLKGLTPGTYRVQAARDGIWLSAAQTLVVGNGALPDLTLDIAPPGVPILLHVVDSSGKPLTGRSVTVERPEGPLTDALWPKTFTVDGSGEIRLEGLEAGRHRILLAPAGNALSTFEVPLSLGSDVPVEQKIIIP